MTDQASIPGSEVKAKRPKKSPSPCLFYGVAQYRDPDGQMVHTVVTAKTKSDLYDLLASDKEKPGFEMTLLVKGRRLNLQQKVSLKLV